MYLYIEDEIKIEINLVPECIERLIEIFNTSSLFRYYTLKEILEHNNIELLYKLIKLKRFDSNDRQFFEYHIKQQSTNKDIFEKLLSIDVNKLSTLRDDDEQLDEFISSYNFKLSLYRIKNILNQENTKHFDLIKKYFFVLLENDKLENDIFYLDGIKSILPLLSLDERMNVLHHIQKQSNCPPPEIEELQRIIVN